MSNQACRWMVLILLFVSVNSPIYGQGQKEKASSSNTYTVSVGSSKNKVQLILANATEKIIKKISVVIAKKPSWFNVKKEEFSVLQLKENEEVPVSFSFGIKEEAVVGDTAEVLITAVSNSGFSWEKSIELVTGAPSKFELLSNYPNPFNPTTTIRYRLPAQMKVEVAIYNILGRKVVTLANELQKAGQHDLQWDAAGMASGLYFYRVVAEGENHKQIVEQKKMMLVK